MALLLISKVNDIRVTQVDESKILIENKKADSQKPAKSSDKSSGENKTIDLGAGAKKHNIKIFAFNSNDIDALLNIFHNERYCEVVDKFVGKIKIYIDKVSIVNSDKHANKTIFSIDATVQDITKVPAINTTAQLEKTVENLEEKLNETSKDFADTVDTVDTVVDENNIEVFFDDSLNILETGLTVVLDLLFVPIDFYSGIQSKVNRIKRLRDTLEVIKTLPNDFADLMLEFTETQTEKNVELFETFTNAGAVVAKNTDISYLSQTERNIINERLQTNQLLNLIVAISEAKQALTKEYKSQQDFDTQIELCINRLNLTQLENDEILNTQYALKEYSNFKTLKKIIDFEVKKETPLASIIFDLYGNLDFYDELRKINNLADNDAIVGTIKVYDESIS